MTDVQLIRVDPSTPAVSGGRPVPFPVIAYGAVKDGELAATFGLAWHHERTWLWFSDELIERRFAVYVVRWARMLQRVAKQLGETVLYSMRAEGPKSKRLHERLGFKMVGKELITFDDGRETVEEVWLWPLSQQ